MTPSNRRAPSPDAVVVVRATPADLDAIMEIEDACFQAPWPRDAMNDEFTKNPWSTVLKAEVDGAVAGFAIYWSVADECHLQNLATAPKFRRRGVGDALVRRLVEDAQSRDAAIILLEVRASNDGAQRLYESHGFAPLGVRRGYYQDDGEDAIVMGLALIEGVL